MGKISKNSNLYDKDGNLLKHVNADGILENYTTKELEDLLNTFVEDNVITDQQKYDNVMSILMERYQKDNDEKSIMQRIEDYIKTRTNSKEEVQNALNQVKESLKNDINSNGETEAPRTGEETEVPGTPEGSTEESRGEQECNPDSESSITA